MVLSVHLNGVVSIPKRVLLILRIIPNPKADSNLSSSNEYLTKGVGPKRYTLNLTN